MLSLAVFDSSLDALVRPNVRVLNRRCSAFHVCGYTGLSLAIAFGVLLTLHWRLSLCVLAAMVLTAVATFLALAVITKIIVGVERLIYYHHEVAILATTTLMLTLSGQPPLAYLDVAILGVGTFLVLERIGCFMVGCCHGCPHHWGVRYRPEHAAVGFPHYYVGVRLVPIQLVESGWVLMTVAVGIGLVLGGADAGAALAWYVIVYDLGRFSFEFARGDPSRHYWGGFSEEQWTSLLLMLVVVVAELAGVIPLHVWHLVATGGVVVVMLGVAVGCRLGQDRRYQLLNPNHIREVASALEALIENSSSPTHFAIPRTSAGLRLSTGWIDTADGVLRHYTLSSSDGMLNVPEARAVTDLIVLLDRIDGDRVLRQPRDGLFQLVAPPSGFAPTRPLVGDAEVVAT